MTSSWLSNLILIGLRLTYFLACKKYVNRSLLRNLKKVIITTQDFSQSTPSSILKTNGPNSEVYPNNINGIETNSSSSLNLTSTQQESSSSFDPISTSTSRPSTTNFQRWLREKLRLKRSDDPDILPLRSTPSSVPPTRRSSISSSTSKFNPSASSSSLVGSNEISTSFSTFLFCWAFSEGSLLFSIVIFGSWLDPLARNINWNLSLGILISTVVFIVPFLECLLFSTSISNKKSSQNEKIKLFSTRKIVLTLIPFGFYLFVYYRVGQTMQGLLGVESGSNSIGFLNTTLARICVPGVFLIASLSGGGAVNTAWETWEWYHREKEPPITEQQISTAEQALYRTKMDLSDRQLTVLQLQQQSQNQSNASNNESIGIIKIFTGSSNPKLAHLQQEISGLQAMEAQMRNDLDRMTERKEYGEYSRTIPGMLLKIANWSLSVYCVYRLFMAFINLVFGYVRTTTKSTQSENFQRNPTTDIVTYLIAKVLSTFNVQLDLMKLTRLVGLVLIGSIIVVNLRSVLVWVQRIFNRVSSKGVSSNLMLLVLGQLMATYLLTCLISLPGSGTTTTKEGGRSIPNDESNNEPDLNGTNPRMVKTTSDLLNTLPSFNRFSRLFDLVFLITGILTCLIRWLGKQIHQNLS